MSDQTAGRAAGDNRYARGENRPVRDEQTAPGHSGSPPAGMLLVGGLALYLFAVAGAALWFLLIEPPIPDLLDGSATPSDLTVLYLVIAMGAIGSVIHAATSLADYVGNRSMVRSWALWFLLRPLSGVLLAVIFFFLVRVGVVQPSSGSTNVDPLPIGAFAALVGMFSKQAVDKLAELFATLFQGGGDAERKDKLPSDEAAPADDPERRRAAIDSVTPPALSRGQQKPALTLAGRGFGPAPEASVNGAPRDCRLEGDGSLVVALSPQDVAAAGRLEVAVLPGGRAALASAPVSVAVQ